jgi:hypothetical protein
LVHSPYPRGKSLSVPIKRVLKKKTMVERIFCAWAPAILAISAMALHLSHGSHRCHTGRTVRLALAQAQIHGRVTDSDARDARRAA